MKKALLLIVLLVVFFSLSIYFPKHQFYKNTPDGPDIAAGLTANLATETPSRTSPAGETRPADRISAKPSEQKAGQIESDLKATDCFADATVLKTSETIPDKNGRYERKRLVRANFKYPQILLEESLQTDSQTGVERLLRQSAMVADHVMVKVPAGVSGDQLNQAVSAYGGHIRKKMYSPDLYLVEFQNVDLDSVSQAVQNFSKASGSIAYAEPDYVVSINDTTPNDTDFNLLWGMHNTGQSAGTPDADIDAPAAWDISVGSSNIVVAVIDTGIDYNHPDLAANMWRNPGEIPSNGIDDDGNGFIDDVYGRDFANDDSNPIDDHYHGTHCSGTIGGVGNNGIGVAGVNWTVRLMALKFLNSSGSGTTSDAVDATHYATMMKVKLTSNSWGGGGYSQGLFDAIEEANKSNILFVAAAGNSSSDTDSSPNYPSSYINANIIAVAATDNRDQLAYFSNYGLRSVDIGAPGVNVYSCQPGGLYQYLSGTSMATPHVAGACALAWSMNPNATAATIKQAVLDGAEQTAALSNRCVTGGRLNVYSALQKFEQNVAITPATGASFSGFCGGPFNPPSSVYTINNIGTNSFSWAAAKTATWLDLSRTNGTLLPSQSNTVVISINTNNANLLAVGTYTDTLTFSNTISTNVQRRTVSLTVHGELSFASTSYSVLEGAGTALISVHRAGNTNRAVTVDFDTSNGTATAGLDYVPTNGTLRFATGDTVKTFCVGIIDDTLSIEPEESLMLTLSNPTGGSTLENPSSSILTIRDNTVTNGLVLKYTFDPDTSPVATDGSPFGNDGQLVNAGVVSGQSGNGVSFNGTNAYIRTPTSVSLMPTSVTMSAWVKFDKAPGAWQMLIFKRNVSLNNHEDFVLDIAPDGRASVALGNGNGQKILYSSCLVTGGWHHVAATFSQPDLKIYVDGQLQGATTYNLPLQHNPDADVLIGCGDHTYNPLSYFFNGLMDDIRIYNRALTAEEIASLVPKIYSLTVNNGSGGGSYENGTLVEIAADTPTSGKIFTQWTGAVQHVDNVTSSVTTVTMPSSNITLTATYTDLAGWYSLTVHNGDGSGSYTNGTAVVITASNPPAGSVFERWIGDTQYVNSVTSSIATVSIPAQNISLTATYRTTLYTLTVENGSGDGSYTNGAVVAVSADTTAGQTFTGWTTLPAAYTNRLANRLSASTTFTMPPTNVILTATYSSLTNGLVLKYTFDPNTSPVATDGSPYGNNGQLTNAAVIPGQSGNCLSLNGSNAYIRTPSSSSLMPTSITMTMWVKITNSSEKWTTLLFKRGVTEGYLLQLSPDGKPTVVLTSGLQTILSSPSSITGGWHHVAATFERPNLKIYVDGQLKGTVTHNYSLQHNAAADLLIGCRDYQGSPLAYFFGGLMDDVRIYNRALSSNEIASLAIPTYLLTVENGSGHGFYTNGTQVVIAADTPASGRVFDRWIGDTQYVNNVTYTNALVTMPSQAISLTATYKDITYNLTVNSGTGGGSYTNGQPVVISADAPASGKAFDQWVGDTQYVTSVTSDPTTVTMPAQAIALTATYKDAYYTLTVTSAYGGSVPDGTNSYNTAVSVMVTNSPVLDDTTQYVCSGWTRTGSEPASGATTNTGLFVMTNDATVVWWWTTNYWLQVDNVGNGSVSTPGGWLAAGSNIQITATADTYYHFTGWSGDTEGDTNSTQITLVMIRPRSVTASFAPNVTANTGTPEWWLAQYGFTDFNADVLTDIDLDGLKTWQEYIAGTDPTNRNSVLTVAGTVLPNGLIVSWFGVQGRSYTFQYAASPTNNWQTYPLEFSGTDVAISLMDLEDVTNRIYRVKVRIIE